MDEKWLRLIPKLCYIVTKTFGDFVRGTTIFGNLVDTGSPEPLVKTPEGKKP
jgi:hypothetical protein